MKRFLSRLFNISPHEWPRVLYSFGLEFWLVVAHTLGHVILIAVTAEHFGAEALPYLWITASLTTVAATATFSPFLEKFDKKLLIYWLGIGSALFLAGSFFVLHTHLNPLWFFTTALLGMSAIGAVLHILIGMLVEGLFTPLEAERIFPFISSSSLIGGVIGGGAISILTGSYFHWNIEPLILLWAGAVLMVAVVNAIYHFWTIKTPYLKVRQKKEKSKGIISELKIATNWMKNLPFIRTLAGIVFVQFVIIQLLEFQYASALTAGSSEHSGGHLIHGLGFYGAIFSGAGLLVQIFFSRRVVHWLGIVRTMMINPLFAVIPFSAMAVKFGAPTAVASKLVFQSTNVVARNAYLASFYAIPEHIRERVKPLIEGWLVSLGAISGTLFLIALERIFHGEHGQPSPDFILTVSIALIVLAIFLVWRFWYLKDHYTQLSVKNLRSNDIQEKHTAIEILAQRGHKNGSLYLTKALHYHRKNPEFKTKILDVLGYSQDPHTVPSILDHLQDENFDVRFAAVRALNRFQKMGHHFETQAFARYRIVTALQELFEKETSGRIRQEIIKVFTKINQAEVVPFLLDILEDSKDKSLKADAIAVIGSFHDPNIAHYLKKYLNHPEPLVRANTIVALWQFPRYRMDLIAPQVRMMSATDIDTLAASTWMLGDIANQAEIKRLRELLQHKELRIKRLAALSLAKMGLHDGDEIIIEGLLDQQNAVTDRYRREVEKTHPRVHNHIKKATEHELSRRITEILIHCEYDLRKMATDEFAELEKIYRILGEHGEIARMYKIRKE